MFTHMNRRFCLKHHSHSVVDLLSWRRFQTLGTPNWVFVQFERGRIQGDCMKHRISEPFGLSSRFAAYRSLRTAWSRLRYASARLLSPNGQGVFHAQARQRSVVMRLHAIALRLDPGLCILQKKSPRLFCNRGDLQFRHPLSQWTCIHQSGLAGRFIWHEVGCDATNGSSLTSVFQP